MLQAPQETKISHGHSTPAAGCSFLEARGVKLKNTVGLDKVVGWHGYLLKTKPSSRYDNEPFHMDPFEFGFNTVYGASKA